MTLEWVVQVAAACLYTICRKHSLPYLLMDFSDTTGINVYILGGVYVSLCSLLCLDTLEAYQRYVGTRPPLWGAWVLHK